MTLNSLIPAIRRGTRLRPNATTMSGTASLCHRATPSPLTREQTRLAVIEVLG